MIIRQATRPQGRCIFCFLLPAQQSRNASSRADLAIPRHNLLDEAITGPTEKELAARRFVGRKYSSPMTQSILERYKLMGYWARTVNQYGSAKSSSTTGLPAAKDFIKQSRSDVSLEALMTAQAHMGHSTSLWNPMNGRYIFGVRAGIHIISLEATAAHLKRAARVVEGVAEQGGLILFVGTRRGQRDHVVRAAKLTGGYHLFNRWIPGTITNGQQLLEQCPVRPVDPYDKIITGYEEEIKEKGPILKPDLVVCLNPLENKTLLHECALHTIPTIGVIDTDADPTTVTYPIPANDDSIRCIGIIAKVLGKAGSRGKYTRMKRIKNGEELPYETIDLTSIGFEDNVTEEDDTVTVEHLSGKPMDDQIDAS